MMLAGEKQSSGEKGTLPTLDPKWSGLRLNLGLW